MRAAQPIKHIHMMHWLKSFRYTMNQTASQPSTHTCQRGAAILLLSLMLLTVLSGCQKRCASLNLGVVKLGVYEQYTPGPVELLEESVHHFKGPDYPQVSVPERIRQGVLSRFAPQSLAAPLIAWLQGQHFQCADSASGAICHLKVHVSREERCTLFGPTQLNRYEDVFTIVIHERERLIEEVAVTYESTTTNKGK
jgi:hypothetical protein